MAGDTTERERLAQGMPRALVAQGRAGRLAEWIISSRPAPVGPRSPAFPRLETIPEFLLARLGEARRARRLARGLEGAGKVLRAEAEGLHRAPATRPDRLRFSRLLVLASDGADRFYRQAERLRRDHAERLLVVVFGVDASTLGGAAFGPGHPARAVLLTHKEAVADLLGGIAQVLEGSAEARSAGPG